MNKFRLRYAPSPTGYLHIGNTRTALMNYIFAKHYNGDFIVRIEDTDIERNVEGAIESQFDNMEWLGIIPDESFLKPNKNFGEYMQSKKLQRYIEISNTLIEKGYAYKCFCSKEELEKERQSQLDRNIQAPKYNRNCWNNRDLLKNKTSEFNVRFKVPDNKEFEIDDLIRGIVSFNSKDIGDFVILKSNGIATYNFAVVVDDVDMEITHVLRGEEHISNTPKQLMIYEAMGWTTPKFGHLTLIVDETRKKLSKRSGNEMFFISEYRKKGFLPQAIFNFVSLLGWSPNIEKEVFTKEELISIFDEKRFSKSPSMFDYNKLKWINSQYMKKLNDADYLSFVKEFINKDKFSISDIDVNWLDEVLLLFKKEIEFGIQINDHLGLFWDNNNKKDFEILKSINNWQQSIKKFKENLTLLEDYNVDSIKHMINNIGKELDIKGMNLFMPIRIAATNSEHGPELAKVIFLLGKNKVLKNIDLILNE
ncbi:glutamate--tRNA ligase [Spiroplasma turonicum]|uniref:Glutamate--tRNA ligase n=1 Tax=Spiroplasma turonicum TaxID=216946 RepID=A0A0K1P7X2_9MOLU|nr:glutamate--tRNA ligase [Spiroplasma turonicum]AKU80299.1 glutamyl-tRNA synthetase [Spiroplasma turonicum]ALX71300.1 glutamyl-tRNA synthetase [Spiroplasma turonicum]